MAIDLPAIGEANWGPKLNTALTELNNVGVAAAGSATAAAGSASAAASSVASINKGVANGVAGLDASAKVVEAQVPTAFVKDYINDSVVQIPRPKLTKWRAALAGRVGTGVGSRANILFIGDSISEYQVNGSISTRWVQLLQKRLRSFYNAPQGPEYYYIPAIYAGTVGATNMPVSNSGGTASTDIRGMGLRSLSLPTGASVTFVVPQATGAVLNYKKAAAGSLSVTINAVAQTAINTTTGSDPSVEQTGWALTGTGTQTIVLTAVGGTQVVDGLLVDNNSDGSINVIDGSHSGYNTTSWPANTTVGAAYYNSLARSFNTHKVGLVVMAQGSNDQGVGVSVATFKANIIAQIANLRTVTGLANASFLLVHMYLNGGRSASTWAQYGAALKEIADADPDVAFRSFYGSMPDVPTPVTDPSGFDLYYDASHPKAKGHQMMADLMLGFLDE